MHHLGRVLPPQEGSWDDIVEWVTARPLATVGFDVYDTLLTRELNDEDAFLSALAQRLAEDGAWAGSADQYVAARRTASTAIPGQGLIDWYQHEALEGADAERCIAAELDLEAETTWVVPGAVDALERIRRSGVALAFVSDMHLPAPAIEETLLTRGLRRPREPVYVSGTVGRWKSTGGLFHHWLAAEGVDPARVAYVGNHPYSDWAVPASMGIHVKARRNGNPCRYESCLGESGVAGAAVAAASTRTRLELDPGGRDVYTRLGTAVAGQALMAWLLAIRARCAVDDVRQIAFVARDGDLPRQMAESMPEDYWSGIELHYLHGNRLTWTLAGAHSVGVDTWIDVGTIDDYGYLMCGRSEVPASSLLRRLGLTVDDLADSPVFPEVDPDAPLPAVDVLWPRLLADCDVRAIVADRARDRFGLVVEYLRGLGLRPAPTLVLDVGWRGQTAAVISGVLHDVLGHEPINYHFGGDGVRSDVDATCQIERYAFDDSREPSPFPGIVDCIEMFTGAGQPRATGYERRGSVVVPVFDDGIEAMASPERDRIWQAAVTMAELMPPAEQLDRWTSGSDPAPDPGAVCELLRRFWTTPTRSEGRAAMRLGLEVDEQGHVIHPVSAPYRVREILTRDDRRWSRGSAVASPMPWRAATSLRRWATSG